VNFEFDPVKSLANKAKHGIDFEEAQKLWLDPKRLVIPARSRTEPRFAFVAQLEGKLWSAFYTIRGSTIRIISVRTAHDYEQRDYQNQEFDR
jgi:uncharacterized DUF497 family protein